MSFFIRKNGYLANNAGAPRKNTGKKRKKRALDEEIESDEGSIEDDTIANSNESDDAKETAQEKKLRLAKLYLEEIERKERELKDGEVDKDAIVNYLREDLKQKSSKFRRAVADSYTGYKESEVRVLHCRDHRASVTCVVVSSDNKYIYSGSKDSTIVKWSLQDCKKLIAVKGLKTKEKKKEYFGIVFCLAISHDNKFLVSGDSKKQIIVWNPESLQHIKTFTGHKGSVTGLAFQKNHHTLYSASSDRSVKVWNLTEMAYVESLFGHQSNITAIDALASERTLTSSEDKSIRLWKIVEESQLIYNAPGGVDCIKFISEDYFLSCGDDGSLCLWGILRKRPLCTIRQAHGIDSTNDQPKWISSISPFVNTDLVASGSSCGAIKLWKCDDNFRKLSNIFSIPVTGFINAMTFTSDGLYLIAAASSEHRLGRWWKMENVKESIYIIPLCRSN